jgi:hypothetical protein
MLEKLPSALHANLLEDLLQVPWTVDSEIVEGARDGVLEPTSSLRTPAVRTFSRRWRRITSL